MRRGLAGLFLLLASAGPALGQSVTCDPSCHQGGPAASSAGTFSHATSRSSSASQSRSSAQGSVNGSVNNGSLSSRATGGTASVTVINAVRSGGGGIRRAASSGASDPPAPAPVPTDPGPALGSAANPLTENIGGTTVVKNVPEIVAPNISGGNPCLVGVSGGGAGPGIGITLGIGYSDRGCERRNSAALLNNIGEKAAAVELMCDDDRVRAALARAGQPCEADRQRALAAAPRTASTAGVDPAVIRH